MALTFTPFRPDPAPLAGAGGNQYSTNSFTYPLNLGADGAGLDHYMIFHVNQNNNTQYSTATVSGQTAPTQVVNGQVVAAQSTLNNNQIADQRLGINSSTTQNTSRVATTIALYIPNDVSVSYKANWTPDDLGAGGMLFGKMANGQEEGSWGDAWRDFGISGLQNLGGVADKELGVNGGAGAGFGFRMAINNHKEILFKDVDYRSFNFEFMFVPTSEAEALNIRNIIQAFKFYWAPEVLAGTAGRFWLYPSEWDITYVSNGVENLWFNRISTCALTDISVNYTPAGIWSAHRASGQITPGVATKLQLTFMELELMQKARILDGF
jgi:hypothetical protein